MKMILGLDKKQKRYFLEASLMGFSFLMMEGFPISCSQILMTIHPLPFNSFLTCLSLNLFLFILFTQYFWFEFGIRQCSRHPCQKQPSINKAILSLGNIKSGFPTIVEFLLQPFKPLFFNILSKTNSVDLFPLALTWAIIRERSFELTVSITGYLTVWIREQFDLKFLRIVALPRFL